MPKWEAIYPAPNYCLSGVNPLEIHPLLNLGSPGRLLTVSLPSKVGRVNRKNITSVVYNQMSKEPFSIISKGESTISVIAHVPHGSTFIPQDVRYYIMLNDADLETELILMTDRFTPELFSGIAALGGLALVNNYSRLVVDPERFENDEDEAMSERGMGAFIQKRPTSKR
jgi:hypothetical protein